MEKKILLLQVREPVIDKIEMEMIIERSGLPRDRFVAKNFLAENLMNLEVGFFSHVIMSGSSAANISDGDKHWFNMAKRLVKDCADKKIPFLGLCFGGQFLAYTFGARIEKRESELGAKEITTFNTKGTFFEFLPEKFLGNNVHKDYIVDLPACLENYGSSDECGLHLIAHKKAPLYGVQFHPEHDKKSVAQFLDFYSGKYCDPVKNAEIVDLMVDPDEAVKSLIPRFLSL